MRFNFFNGLNPQYNRSNRVRCQPVHWRLCLFALVALTVTAPMRLVASANPFPSLEAYQLSTKKAVTLPNQLPGGKTFIALGFDPKQQALLEKGMLLAEPLRKTHPALNVIEIPVIESKYQSLRGTIDVFMKKAVKTPQFKDRVYPLFTNMAALKTKLGLPRHQEYAFLLIDQQGRVLWKSTAPPTSANFLTPLLPLLASD